MTIITLLICRTALLSFAGTGGKHTPKADKGFRPLMRDMAVITGAGTYRGLSLAHEAAGLCCYASAALLMNSIAV